MCGTIIQLAACLPDGVAVVFIVAVGVGIEGIVALLVPAWTHIIIIGKYVEYQEFGNDIF